MNENTLAKLIDKLLLPKYSWVEDFRITLNTDDEYDTVYIVSINVQRGKKDLNVSADELQKLRNEIKSIFTMLGPSRNEFLKIVYV